MVLIHIFSNFIVNWVTRKDIQDEMDWKENQYLSVSAQSWCLDRDIAGEEYRFQIEVTLSGFIFCIYTENNDF